MTTLPKAFVNRMQNMLQEDYPAFIASYEKPRQYGLRVNTLKISTEDFLALSPFSLRPIPWIKNGFFYREEDRPSKHPHYFAGLYYLQEPSAMTPASCLPIQPGDRVLDLCAAPGGKATELGARLRGKGILIANDVSISRGRALLKNLELFGISNSLVTNELPQNLLSYFPEYFNKILVDAPCSGEGMFRKDPDVSKTWDPARPNYFASLQKGIMDSAVSMLCPGGLLLYSTCTFSPQENEGTISHVLEQFPDMELLELPWYEGFSAGNPLWGNGRAELTRCVRIWPHRMEGEGHFMALLRKKGDCPQINGETIQGKKRQEEEKLLFSFLSQITMPLTRERLEIRGANAYYLPPSSRDLRGIRFLRNGLYLGELKKNRFEPSQPFAMALKMKEFPSCLNLSSDDDRIIRYLKGETISLEPPQCSNPPSWQLVCVDGYPLGWGKLVGQTLKNKYLNSWRIH